MAESTPSDSGPRRFVSGPKALDTAHWSHDRHRRPGRRLGPRAARRRRRGRRCRRCSTRPTRAPHAFADAHAGRVAELDGPGLAAAMGELEAISDLLGRAGNYAHLRFAVDTDDPANGALVAQVQELGDRDRDQAPVLRARVGGARRRACRRAAGGRRPRHAAPPPAHVRRYRPHLLSEAEEKLMAEKSVTGSERLVAAVQRADERDPRRPAGPRRGAPARRRAEPPACPPTARSAARPPRRSPPRSQPGPAHARVHLQHAAAQDKATDDRLRSYPTWLSQPQPLQRGQRRVGARRCSRRSRGRYDLPQRWYKLKAQLLGLDRLADYDRAASIAPTRRPVPTGRTPPSSCWSAYSSFSPVLGDLGARFFDERWIDAPVAPGKRGGAFCAYTMPSVHPYLMLNYTVAPARRARRSRTSSATGCTPRWPRPRGIFEQHTPLTVCETASVFGETLVFRRLLDEAGHAASRGSRCWPRTSRARSRRSSARPR